ncbi:hypothetical protein NDU88_004114 [Pleurodeles waltl]|uniref:Uncharacterized protein n=1 Tax=Pleurodeles waltl TaxID=8319 RepID=A0AAV7TQD7_PLEWA|nr:hypothetical protein NDU88_004114 [Pleurodeles waltl]
MRAPPHAGRSLHACRGRLHHARLRLPVRGGAASLFLLRAEQHGPPLAPSPRRGLGRAAQRSVARCPHSGTPGSAIRNLAAGRSLHPCRGRLRYARSRLPVRGGAASLSSLGAEQHHPPLSPSPRRGLGRAARRSAARCPHSVSVWPGPAR